MVEGTDPDENVTLILSAFSSKVTPWLLEVISHSDVCPARSVLGVMTTGRKYVSYGTLVTASPTTVSTVSVTVPPSTGSAACVTVVRSSISVVSSSSATAAMTMVRWAAVNGNVHRRVKGKRTAARHASGTGLAVQRDAG